MKDKIIIFIVGLLLGAIISTGSIYIYTVANKNNFDINKEIPNNIDNGMRNDLDNPREIPNNNENNNNNN